MWATPEWAEPPILEELEGAFCLMELNDAVRVIILTGAGSKAFVAGADNKAMAGLSNSGLSNRVAPGAEPLDTSRQVARTIARNGGVGLAMAKEAIGKGYDMTLSEGLAFEGNLFALLFATEDRTEGLSAFIEKRKPTFINR